MTTSWTSMALRPNLTSTEGQVPITGDFSSSPDIVVQPAPDPDPQATFSAPGSWQQDYPAQVYEDTANFVYVRARSWAPGPETTTVTAYAVPANLILWPQAWLTNPLQTDFGETSVQLAAAATGDIAVTTHPFAWSAPPPSSGATQTCLVALLDSAADPNPVLHGFVPQSYADLAALICGRLDIGTKNLVQLVGNESTFLQRMPLSVPPGMSAGLLWVSVAATPGLAGGQFSLVTDGGEFTPPVTIGRTTISARILSYGVLTHAPEDGADAVVTLSFWQETSSPGPGDSLSVGCGWVPTDPADVDRLRALGLGQRLPGDVAAGTPGWFFPLGDLTLSFGG